MLFRSVSDLLALTQRERDLGEEWLPGTIVPPPARPYYLRFVVQDRPGIIASIASTLAREGINLDALLQMAGDAAVSRPGVEAVSVALPDAGDTPGPVLDALLAADASLPAATALDELAWSDAPASSTQPVDAEPEPEPAPQWERHVPEPLARTAPARPPLDVSALDALDVVSADVALDRKSTRLNSSHT